MNRNEIVKNVQAYIRNDNAKYALLINGAWGSGKTFLYENYLAGEISDIEVGKNERKFNMYVSLYGVSSIESLSKQVLTSYLICTKANDSEIVKKGVKPIAGILGIVSKAFSFSIGSFSADLDKAIEGISNLINVKNMVVCFDDLERCTIPINEFFGYVNNLIEHCNCKVLILADENNIGKIFANTNIEQKYQTILTGDRKVIRDLNEDSRKRNGDVAKDTITVKELKELNELLYSENFIYRDIKEKVIGKTCDYYPKLEELLVELISGTDKYKGYIEEGNYKEFLMNNIDSIAVVFNEVDNRNLRIVIVWLDIFRNIFAMTYKNLNTSKYYENIISDFLRYSIWAIVSSRKNKKIIRSAYYGHGEYVYFEEHENTHIFRYHFIDKYIRSEFLDETDLVRAARTIETRCGREDFYSKKPIKSTGVAYSKLYDWRYMEDDAVKECVQEMLVELKENKYAYDYYSNILDLLLYFNKIGLYEGNISEVQEIMLSLIDNDMNIQEENNIPRSFSNEEDKQKYIELYNPIAENRKRRNRALDQSAIEEEKIYINANLFLEHCQKREEYYSSHKSFMEYINKDKLIELINHSSLADIYTIAKAFKTVYFMGNVRDFYINDIDALQCLKSDLCNEERININGITRKCAIEHFSTVVEGVLVRLGVGNEIE
ncbi:MAG: KAP family NTPase [Ruminococcus flavefaciens]|nr:KAP family NTPase [Ruminococcus flavefaciens]